MDDRRLEDIRRRFRLRCRADAALLRVQVEGGLDEAARSIVHRIAGLAGALGYLELSAQAAALDDDLAFGKAAPAARVMALVDALDEVSLEAGA